MKIPTPSEYPTRIILGDGDEWELKFVRRIPDSTKDSSGRCVDVGQTDPSEYKMYIKRGLCHTETLGTFVHEMLHAFEESYDIKLKHSDVYKLERAIVDFLVVNL